MYCPLGQVNDCALVCHDDIIDNGICDDIGCAQYDDCGVCSGGSTSNTPNADQDCNGDCLMPL